jgi:hypothetical protein
VEVEVVIRRRTRRVGRESRAGVGMAVAIVDSMGEMGVYRPPGRERCSC